jgi:hypothetical protein
MRNMSARRLNGRPRRNLGVMPGLVPGIHAFLVRPSKVVDGRDKPGHDDREVGAKWLTFVT